MFAFLWESRIFDNKAFSKKYVIWFICFVCERTERIIGWRVWLFKKNIYLYNTLSAHQRGETCGKRFLFFREYVKFHLSESKFSDFTNERWCGRYSTRTAYINISVRDVLYINNWRGCLLSSLSYGRVSLALILDNGATAFTSFLYPVGLFAPKT